MTVWVVITNDENFFYPCFGVYSTPLKARNAIKKWAELEGIELVECGNYTYTYSIGRFVYCMDILTTAIDEDCD